jgi:hypothetical protein
LIKKDLITSIEELYHLQNCELAMGEYYQQLADRSPDERLFWAEAISDEVNHARMVGRIVAMVSSNPNAFNPGKFRVAVLVTFLTGVYGQIERFRGNALSPAEELKIAYDYEVSAIMSRPYDIVESHDPQFMDLRNKFAEEVAVHNNRIRQYIEQKLGMQNNTRKIKLQSEITPGAPNIAHPLT